MRTFALAAILVGTIAAATPRELVYAYTFESNRTYDADHAYGIAKADPGGGGTFYIHNIDHDYRPISSQDGTQRRSGTIAVDVVREEPDGGFVLRVRESLPGAAAGDGFDCVAFGDTTVVCDPNHPIGPEIPALLGLLGKDFVDPSRLDAARHWRIGPQAAYGTTADYRIVGNAGTLLEIEENGIRTQQDSPAKTSIGAKIQYDEARSLPTSFDESTVERTQRGAVTVTTSTRTVVKLESATPPQ